MATHPALSTYIADAVSKGWRIETQTETTAAMAMGRPVNHVLHLLIGVFTCGFWWVVWVFIATTNKRHRLFVSVNADGHVSATNAQVSN